jgi:predicted amidophosphoribosyltransferase
MALVNCYECRNQVSDKAASCPGCGAPKPRWGCKFCSGKGRSGNERCGACNGDGHFQDWTNKHGGKLLEDR